MFNYLANFVFVSDIYNFKFMINSISDEDDPEYFPYEVIDLSRFDPMLASTVESLYTETSVCNFTYFIMTLITIYSFYILTASKTISQASSYSL